jgi:plastocyanin
MMVRRLKIPVTVTALSALLGVFIGTSPAAVGSGQGGFCRGVPVTREATTLVRMKDFCFRPTIAEVAAGSKVTWKNKDTEAHSVTGANVSWGTYDEIQPGQSVSYRFDEPGIYPYYCFLHVGMIGAVVVTGSA